MKWGGVSGPQPPCPPKPWSAEALPRAARRRGIGHGPLSTSHYQEKQWGLPLHCISPKFSTWSSQECVEWLASVLVTAAVLGSGALVAAEKASRQVYCLRIVERITRRSCIDWEHACMRWAAGFRCPPEGQPGFRSRHQRQLMFAGRSFLRQRWQYLASRQFPAALVGPSRFHGLVVPGSTAILAGCRCGCQAATGWSAIPHGFARIHVPKHNRPMKAAGQRMGLMNSQRRKLSEWQGPSTKLHPSARCRRYGRS